MTDEVIHREPLTMAPLGVPVRLGLTDATGDQWRSTTHYVRLDSDRWVSVASGLPLPSTVQAIGWSKAHDT